MRPLFNDATVLHHGDAVGRTNGRQPVRDDQRGAPRHQPFERAQERCLGLGIERTGGFVEDENGRVLQHGPRNRQPLPFAARERGAALAELGVVARGQTRDEVVRLCRAGSGFDLRARGVAPADRDVLGDRPRKQERVLEHDGHLLAHIAQPHIAQVVTIDQHAAAVRIGKTRNHRHQRALATAGGADNRHPFARTHVERDIVQNAAALVIPEAEVLELQVTAHRRQWPRVGPFGRLARRFEHLGDTIDAGTRRLHGLVGMAQNHQLLLQRRQIRHEDQRAAQCELAVEHTLRRQPQHSASADGGDQARPEAEHATGERHLPLGANGLVGEVVEASLFECLAREGLHHRHASQRLLDVRPEPAFDFALRACRHPDGPAEQPRRSRHEGRDRQRQHGQPRIEAGHHRHHGHQRDERVARCKQQRIDHRVHAPAVAGDAAERIAGGGVGVEGQRTALQMREEIRRQVLHHLTADARPAERHDDVGDAGGDEENNTGRHHPRQ